MAGSKVIAGRPSEYTRYNIGRRHFSTSTPSSHVQYLEGSLVQAAVECVYFHDLGGPLSARLGTCPLPRSKSSSQIRVRPSIVIRNSIFQYWPPKPVHFMSVFALSIRPLRFSNNAFRCDHSSSSVRRHRWWSYRGGGRDKRNRHRGSVQDWATSAWQGWQPFKPCRQWRFGAEGHPLPRRCW